MFWLISLFVVGFVGVLIGKKEKNSDSGLFCAMFAVLCWMLVCTVAHISFIKPEFSSENIRLISNEVIVLDEHYQKTDKIGNVRFLLPVKDGKLIREKEFVITPNLPEFKEIFNGERKDCYVVKSNKYKEAVLQVYKFKESFFYIGEIIDSIYVLVLPESIANEYY